MTEAVHAALCALCDEQVDVAPTAARALLGDLLISRAEPCPEPALAAVDKVLAAERFAVPPIMCEDLPGAQWLSVGATRLAVWRGDIRRLKIGAVVNAANDQGLGCFHPSHRCIDNVLHRAAGPRLREECRKLMAQRGPLIAGSAPLLTSGYNLHAAHVLHVTGPALHPPGRQPTSEEQARLSACYTGCLEAAAAAGIRSVAFCCISTGLFGYPSEAAAAVALSSVARWLLAKPKRQQAIDTIVFDVFTEHDEAAYTAALPRLASAAPGGDCASEEAAADAIRAIAGCDKLLIVAAAGLSISLDQPNNPYHAANDFALHYPAATRYGYRTAYHCNGPVR